MIVSLVSVNFVTFAEYGYVEGSPSSMRNTVPPVCGLRMNRPRALNNSPFPSLRDNVQV